MAKTFTLDINNIKQGYAKSRLVHQHESRSHAFMKQNIIYAFRYNALGKTKTRNG